MKNQLIVMYAIVFVGVLLIVVSIHRNRFLANSLEDREQLRREKQLKEARKKVYLYLIPTVIIAPIIISKIFELLRKTI